ncbi:hypothetical protein ACHAW5_008331 [Stephanodiscus triporus]|uniref:Uncharacterized protein n=1 Tax=Stephanodiscus triporus TaxID=2934178 RepID=A0ABD3PBZ6_9STRA
MPPPPPGEKKQKKKKKGRPPAHQNAYAFRHNPKSKKTERILSSPNVGVCVRCRDKIEWRKKYRKYRPLTHPSKCNLCGRRNVRAAYHTLCGECASGDVAIDAMEVRLRRRSRPGATETAETTTSSSSSSSSTYAAASGEAAAAAEVDDDDDDDEGGGVTRTTSTTTRRRRMRLRVCAVCASEPAASEFSDVHPDDVDVVLRIEELEDSLRTGLRVVVDDDADDNDGGERERDDGAGGGGTKKMTLREIRGVERAIAKCREELGERKRGRAAAATREGVRGKEEEEVVERGDDDGSSDEDEDEDVVDGGDSADEEDDDGRLDDRANGGGGGEDDDEEDDPFLLATGGRALVGEDYRRMMLERGGARDGEATR